MTKSTFEELHIVVCALDKLIDNAISRLAAVEAYETVAHEHEIPATSAEFLEASYVALKDGVTIAVASIFERDKTCGKTNCSLGEVKNLLGNDTAFRLSDTNRKELANSIECLTNKYKNSGIDDLRKKTKAHYDLDEFFIREQEEGSVDDLKNLLFGARKIMCDFFNKWLDITVTWENYDNRVSRYKQALLACIS